MSLTLYHYVHCPYCVRVRMALGYFNLSFKSEVVPYDDEETPVRLSGKKMLPILAHDQGAMNESLDIIAFLDKENSLQVPSTIKREDFKLFEQLLNQIGEPVHSMAMPYWIYTPEFSPEARVYFQKKKEMKRGPFKDLVKNRRKFEEQLNPLLNEVEKKLCPFFESQHFSLKDILIASHLWGLYIVPEFQFSEKLHHYLQEVKTICHFDYHQDFWR